MTAELGTWLRHQREQRGWSRNDMARRLIGAAREVGAPATPDLSTVTGYIRRWEPGKVSVLSERYILLYCRAFGITLAQFGPDADQPASTAVPVAATESSEPAGHTERRDFGAVPLGQLHADVARLSAGLMTGEPFSVFLEMRRIREDVCHLLEGRLRPGDQTELYFLAGCLSDLMAVAAAGLGSSRAAEELIRAGWAYATAIEHRPLMAHLRLQLASIMLWDGQPRRARDLAADGLRYVAAGTCAVHLSVKYAQAAARIGDADGARRALADASDARDSAHADDMAAIGGEFDLSVATEHYFSGAALAEIEGAGQAAASRLEQAVSLYEAGPRPGEQHWFGAKAMAGIDLATVRLRTGALDAAIAAIEPALSLPSAWRISSLITRLRLVRAELAAPVFRGAAQARELDERIEVFTRDSVTAGLRALPAGPT